MTIYYIKIITVNSMYIIIVCHVFFPQSHPYRLFGFPRLPQVPRFWGGRCWNGRGEVLTLSDSSFQLQHLSTQQLISWVCLNFLGTPIFCGLGYDMIWHLPHHFMVMLILFWESIPGILQLPIWSKLSKLSRDSASLNSLMSAATSLPNLIVWIAPADAGLWLIMPIPSKI